MTPPVNDSAEGGSPPPRVSREITVGEAQLCHVRTWAGDSSKIERLADALERCNRRAMAAWIASGRRMP